MSARCSGSSAGAGERQSAVRNEPLLAVEDLRVHFWTGGGTVHAVNGISFEIGPGETLGIVGESGCGKSVTALALLGLLPRAGRVRSGTAHFDGRDLLQLKQRALRRIRGRQIAMIFQDPMTSLNPVLTIGRQIRESLQTHLGLDKKQATARTADLLDQVGIPSAEARLKDYPHQFSGGMRQRAMIAMALACKPKLLIADEPTTALDVTIQAQILDLMRETPRHPYTLGLLQSVPRLDAARRAQLQPIEGAPRDMLNAPSACPFQPRCRYEVEESRREVPPLVEIEPGHKVACFNPVPAEEWERARAAATA
ncbi:MAG: ABC transporter ATP-binding protein [Actinobacteria bacterium]|nr:MAG: ABC transporter ATP-binding protein [Actinomycetota bacterium]